MHQSSSATTLSKLNPKQEEAVEYLFGPLLILAGAGTGKTTVLTRRIAHILHSGNGWPRNILAVTFTNKAAREMEHRISAMVSSEGLWIGTFHSIAARILRYHAPVIGLSSSFNIIDAADQIQLTKNLLEAANIDIKIFQPKMISSIISKWKDKNLLPEEVPAAEITSDSHKTAQQIYAKYQETLVNSNTVDFGDLLLYNNKIFNKSFEILSLYQQRFKYIMIDEYQDTNVAQYNWVKMLAGHYRNICCVGDDDQSIYSWRGAEITNILRFEHDFQGAKVIKLEQNYRSTNQILKAASGLISNNKNRHDKTLWTNTAIGDKVELIKCPTDKDEARFIASKIEQFQRNFDLNKIAVLVRTGYQTRAFEEVFFTNSIAYRIVGGYKFYERLEIRDVIAYIRLSVNHQDSIAFERIVNTPKRSIGNATISIIKNYAHDNGLAIFNASKRMTEQKLLKPKITSVLTDFIEQIERAKARFIVDKPHEVVKALLEETGYIAMWKLERTDEARDRISNINELLSAIAEYDSIESFLEHASLAISNESDNDPGQAVNIMTLHAAKGLEFDVVFLPGWEEGLFPNQRAILEEGTNGLEEERRIAYVGITRAKKHLYITHAVARSMYGDYNYTIPSRFIKELPEDVLNSVNLEDIYSSQYDSRPRQKFNKISLHDVQKSGAEGGQKNDIRQLCADRSNSKITNMSQPIYKEPISKKVPGAKVRHAKFGEGIILKRNDDTLDIWFNDNGAKTIKENFVDLIII